MCKYMFFCTSKQVLGASGVLFTDLNKATVTSVGGEWAIRNVQTTYLTDGDSFDFTSKKV